MNVYAITPDFTGSVRASAPAEVLQAKMPFRVVISVVQDVTNGAITHTWFDWDVFLQGVRIGYRDPMRENPKTRKAAISAARMAIRAYCNFAQHNAHKR